MSVSMRQMLEAGVHFGHKTRFWHPKMAHYIYGERNKIHIIDLEKTMPLYKDAMNYISSVTAKKGVVLFVGTKRTAQKAIKEEAIRCGMPYVDQRWLGGLLTNFRTIKKSVQRLKDLEEVYNGEEAKRYTKKELTNMRRELRKLQNTVGGIKDMQRAPDVLFVNDIGNEKIAIEEAIKLNIPIVAIVDTNNNPAGIDYVIPGNDDSMRAIKLYASGVADAVLEGKTSQLTAAVDNDPVEATPKKKVAKGTKDKKSATITTKKKKVIAADKTDAVVADKEAAPVVVDAAAKEVAEQVAEQASEQASEPAAAETVVAENKESA